MAMFSDCKFFFSVTLEAKQWREIVLALRAAGNADLANEVESKYGLRPE